MSFAGVLSAVATLCLGLTLSGAAPDFSMVGYATLGSGTIGGTGGTTVTVSTLSDLQKYTKTSGKYIIYISGTISGGTDGAQVNLTNDKTLLGVGSTALLQGVGLRFKNVSNIIVRNIKFTMKGVTKTATNSEGRQQVVVNDGDCIYVNNAHNLWFDHNEFYNESPATQTNKDLYDGFIDAIGESYYITISYNYFHDHWKCNLFGGSDTFNWDTRATFHHNYYKNLFQRLPSVRFGKGHVFNNYYSGILSSAVNSRMGACLKVEANYFENSDSPILTKDSASDGYWDVDSNVFSNCTNSQPTTDTCTWSAAYTYSSVLETAASAKTTVTSYAGIGKISV